MTTAGHSRPVRRRPPGTAPHNGPPIYAPRRGPSGKALECEPSFAVASADLELLAGTGPAPTAIGTHAWERHHIEIVRSVQAGDRQRAVALLADHLLTLGCDPIATRIVAPDDHGYRRPECHPAAWAPSASEPQPQGAKPAIEDRAAKGRECHRRSHSLGPVVATEPP